MLPHSSSFPLNSDPIGSWVLLEFPLTFLIVELPECRIYTVPYEDTTCVVPCENMTYPVPYEDTTYIVPFCQKK